jgi:hypothetical protein
LDLREKIETIDKEILKLIADCTELAGMVPSYTEYLGCFWRGTNAKTLFVMPKIRETMQ